MQFNRIIAAGCALMATVTASTAFAQSTTDQQDPATVAVSTMPEPTSMQSDPAAPITRAQVARELRDFQNSPQAVEMRELYRGS
jgi:hypothetical protein